MWAICCWKCTIYLKHLHVQFFILLEISCDTFCSNSLTDTFCSNSLTDVRQGSNPPSPPPSLPLDWIMIKSLWVAWREGRGCWSFQSDCCIIMERWWQWWYTHAKLRNGCYIIDDQIWSLLIITLCTCFELWERK